MKDQGLTDLVTELEAAGVNAVAKSTSADKRLKAIGSRSGARPEYLRHRSKSISLSDPDYDRKMADE